MVVLADGAGAAADGRSDADHVLRDSSQTKAACPTLYSTDQGTFIVQGKKIGDAAAITLPFGINEEEAVVEVPAVLLEEIACDVVFPEPDGGQGVRLVVVRAAPRDALSSSVSATSRGSFVVRGLAGIETGPERGGRSSVRGCAFAW